MTAQTKKPSAKKDGLDRELASEIGKTPFYAEHYAKDLTDTTFAKLVLANVRNVMFADFVVTELLSAKAKMGRKSAAILQNSIDSIVLECKRKNDLLKGEK